MKLISWNVNGFRACLQKGFEEFFSQSNADIFCLQETKIQLGQVDFAPEGYHIYYNCAQKKGYSGTAVFTKTEPISVVYGIEGEHNDEGRVITLEYEGFFLVNCYVPNAQRELARIDYRMEFEDSMREYLASLAQGKPVVYCGDLNVAHMEIDLRNPKQNIGGAGFSQQERDRFTMLLEAGFTDSFRHLYPDTPHAYTWWSYRAGVRERNIGWRIDYFVVSNSLRDKTKAAEIYPQVLGSDHCPVGLELDI